VTEQDAEAWYSENESNIEAHKFLGYMREIHSMLEQSGEVLTFNFTLDCLTEFVDNTITNEVWYFLQGWPIKDLLHLI
jgi:hypothetical protein